jgi:hypothetical protein
MKRQGWLVGTGVLLMVANFAIWAAAGLTINFVAALLCGMVALLLVRWG